MAEKMRLDAYLTEHGLCESREKAKGGHYGGLRLC